MDPETYAFGKMGKLIDDETCASRKESMFTQDLAPTFTNRFKRIQWMWNSSTDSFSTSEPEQWHPYTDVTNMIIEEAFMAGKSHVFFDDYHIDLKEKLQISNNDVKKQQPVKRIECNTYEKCLRKERYMPNPIAPKRPYGGLYGFISPFIMAVIKDFKLKKDQLPSQNEAIVPMIVEKAALGIIEEGRKIGEQKDAIMMANTLMEKKALGMKEVWTCCAKLYSLQSFLYKILNDTMRLIGSEEHEQVWQSKVRTLGPFSLLLWDDPFNSKMTKPGTILYRGAQLSDDLIAQLKDDCFTHPKPLRSFQAFTSSSRNPEVAEMYGNVIFIMDVCLAFTMNLQPYSNFYYEEEELISPGVCFTIDRMDFDKDNKKHLIYLNLQHRHASKSIQCSITVFH
jgi:hypothetical protein